MISQKFLIIYNIDIQKTKIICYNIRTGKKLENIKKENMMNQILVTEKLYITPELKRKKKIYKFEFILSVFLVCILTSFYIYAEYDRNKSEETSQEILADLSEILSTTEEDTTVAKEDVLMVILNDDGQSTGTIQDITEPDIAEINRQAEKRTTQSGYTYKAIATINIPKINVNYSILQGETGTLEEIEALLKLSPCKYWGCETNEVGNFCIVGHNYRNDKFFSKVPTLVVGDTVNITDLSGRTITYAVYDKYTVDPADTSCTTQKTGGKKEITLITCTDDSKQRVVVKCREVKE
jgi:LPXTG-site transpeptidase (sortase) family protein